MDALSRWCLFCHAEMHSGAKSGPTVRLVDYANDIIHRSASGLAFRIYESENRIARVSDARLQRLPNGRPALAMVITLGDRRGANPAFLHYERGHARDAERLEGEVPGVSAHCVIELEEDLDHVGRYRALVEEVRGMGRTPITRLLRAELRGISEQRDERFISPETGGLNQVRPVIDIWPEKSREMTEALERGSFSMIELYDTRGDPAFDEQPDFAVQRRTLKVKVSPHINGTMRGALDRLSALGREQGYSMMKVSWRLPGGDTGMSELRTDLEDIGTALLSRREMVKIENPMSACTHRINDEFLEAMSAQFD